jgi:hypothetical protein
MRLINDYSEFCELYKKGKVSPDVRSSLGFDSVQFLKRKGWKIRGIFFNKRRAARDLMEICRQSEENFLFACNQAGIDFWTND